jgi:acyl carrier protein
MPNRENIRKRIHENFILDEGDHLRDEDSLLERGVIDSSGVLEWVAFMDSKYGLTVEEEELIPEHLDSIRNIIDSILRKATARQGKEVKQSVGL